MKAYRRPLWTPRRRTLSYQLPRSILHSQAFLSQCEAALGELAGKPALIVWGADFAFRARERRRFETLLPDHRTIMLRGAGHYIWEDAPEEIASAMCDWFSKRSRP